MSSLNSKIMDFKENYLTYLSNNMSLYHEDIEFKFKSLKQNIISYFNFGIPTNIYGLSGCGKSTFIKEIINKNGSYTTLLSYELRCKYFNEIRYETRIYNYTDRKNIILDNISKVNPIMMLINASDLLNSYLFLRLLTELVMTLIYNYQDIDNIQKKDYNKHNKEIDKVLASLITSDDYFNKNLIIIGGFMKILNPNRIILIIDNINDPEILSQYNWKLNKLISLMINNKQNYCLITSFPIKPLSTRLITDSFVEVNFPYIFPNKILEEKIFYLLKAQKYDDNSKMSRSRSRSKSIQNVKRKIINKVGKSKNGKNKKDKNNCTIIKESVRINKGLRTSRIENFDKRKSYKKKDSESESESSNERYNLKSNFDSDENSEKSNNCENEKSIKINSSKNSSKINNSEVNSIVEKDTKLKYNDESKKLNEFIFKSKQNISAYTYNYSEIFYFYQFHSEPIVNQNINHIVNFIKEYLKGSYIHFNQSTDCDYNEEDYGEDNEDKNVSKSKKRFGDNYEIYRELIEKNQEDLKFFLSPTQKLFMYSVFLSSYVNPIDDAYLFINKGKAKKYRRQNYNDNMCERSIGSTYKIGLNEYGIIKKNQNFRRILEIYRCIIERSTFKNLQSKFVNNLKLKFNLELFNDVSILIYLD